VSHHQTPPSSELGSEDARDAVAAIVQKADARQRVKDELAVSQGAASGPPKPFFARPPVAASLMAVFIAILSMNVYIMTRPVEPPTRAELDSAARMETATAALQIEAYKQAHGGYPASLGDAGVRFQGVDYARTSDGFILSANGGPPGITHQAGQDPEDLIRAMPTIGGSL